MKKLKTSIAMLILALLTITGVIQPITAYAADPYTVRKEKYGDLVDSLYVKNMNTGEDVVGYCYNAHKSWPGVGNQSVTKFENASNDQFLQLVADQTKLRNRETLREDILRVCYKGFPRDGIGLRQKYNLGKDVFRMITQTAVWYYTDGMNLEQTTFYKFGYPWMWTENAKNAYYELLNTPVTLPPNYTLDLYQNNAPKYQNILSTTLPENYIPPKSIEFSKKDETLSGAELGGATLQVLGNDGSLIEQWTTDGNTHKVDLFAGDYIFRETAAPNGYVTVSEIQFNVDDNGNVRITSKANNEDIAEGGASKLTVVDKKVPIVYKPLTVKKVWELYGHQESEIPDSVQVQLYADGAAFGDVVTLKKADGWTYTWPQLDSSKTYEVREVNTPDNCVSRIENIDDKNVTIYNSMKPELTVEKIVRDGEWADKTREFDFRIELKDENNQPINGNFAYAIENKDGGQISAGDLQVQNGWTTFKLGHNQKIKIKGLPPKVTYRVEEVSDGNAAFKASYKISNQKEAENCPFVQIANDNPNNVVTVYNTFKYIVDTGIDLNNNYTVPGVLLIIAGILLFGGIAVLRFRKRLK